MLVLHQSKYVSAIECMPSSNRHLSIFVFFHVFVCSLLLPCMLKSSRLRMGVGVKTSHHTFAFTD